MTHKIVILDSAKEELKDIKKYVKNKVNSEYKNAFKRIKSSPKLGSPIDELKALGITNLKTSPA